MSFVEKVIGKNKVGYLYRPRYGGVRVVTDGETKSFDTKEEAIYWLDEV